MPARPARPVPRKNVEQHSFDLIVGCVSGDQIASAAFARGCGQEGIASFAGGGFEAITAGGVQIVVRMTDEALAAELL